ncbi:hypothetical protein E2C01_073108 [Portunus trituberculatus]|uniref:Uncharacterized protein n=1 Tax=Portunus trituberculatus TaxID=210409 RepID=A0A5B7I9Q4_PORTR|nr:hypothetical protein [Portunus trituberculatus]
MASMAGMGEVMELKWLQVIGLCPYVVVSPEGACRVGWVPAVWCAVRLVVVVAIQVAILAVPETGGWESEKSIATKLSMLALRSGSQTAFTLASVVVLACSPRLPRLVQELTALRRMAATLSPPPPLRHNVFTQSFMWANAVYFLFCLSTFSASFLRGVAGDGWWLTPLLDIVFWVLSFASLPGVVLLLTGTFLELQAATRAVLPPRWEELVSEVRAESTQSLLWSAATPLKSPTLPLFLRRAHVTLVQAEEVLACLIQYLGSVLLLWLACGTPFFTFSVYLLLVQLKEAKVDYNFTLTVLILTTLLAINMAVEHLMKEVRRRGSPPLLQAALGELGRVMTPMMTYRGEEEVGTGHSLRGGSGGLVTVLVVMVMVVTCCSVTGVLVCSGGWCCIPRWRPCLR